MAKDAKGSKSGTCWITGAKGPTTPVRTIVGTKVQVSTALLGKGKGRR